MPVQALIPQPEAPQTAQAHNCHTYSVDKVKILRKVQYMHGLTYSQRYEVSRHDQNCNKFVICHIFSYIAYVRM